MGPEWNEAIRVILSPPVPVLARHAENVQAALKLATIEAGAANLGSQIL
jgi:hypothetical protein